MKENNEKKKEINFDLQVKKAFKISSKRCVVQLNSWEEKLDLLKNKKATKGKEI